MENQKVLVIIPAYNEQENIEKVLKALEQSYPWIDCVVINDASTDKTEQILKSCKANYVTLPLNLGIGGGVQTGYQYAKERNYDIAVQMDGDGQHLPEYLDDVIRPVMDGRADVVIGSRFIKKEGFQSSAGRRLGIRLLSFMIKILCGSRIKDVTSGYRAVNRKYIDLFSKEYAQDYPEPEALVQCSLSGARIMEIPVVMKERTGGSSSITIFKSVYYMIKVSLALVLQKISWNGGKYK